MTEYTYTEPPVHCDPLIGRFLHYAGHKVEDLLAEHVHVNPADPLGMQAALDQETSLKLHGALERAHQACRDAVEALGGDYDPLPQETYDERD